MLCKHQLDETWFLRLDIPALPPAISSRWQEWRGNFPSQGEGPVLPIGSPDQPVSLLDQTHQSLAAIYEPLSCAGGRGGRGLATRDSLLQGQRTESLPVSFLYFFLLQKIPEISLWFNLHPLSLFSVLFRSLNVCVLRYCPKRGGWTCSGLVLTDLQCIDLRSQIRCSTEMTPGERIRPQGEVCLGPTSSFHIPSYCFWFFSC